jgi:hypothetical protein
VILRARHAGPDPISEASGVGTRSARVCARGREESERDQRRPASSPRPIRESRAVGTRPRARSGPPAARRSSCDDHRDHREGAAGVDPQH